ncbi:MAG: tetratricopeptide repeat protein [Flavobacteriales bacterium]|nr:tetratricopeptide repeat protein [Flavobacteriales bacterium]
MLRPLLLILLFACCLPSGTQAQQAGGFITKGDSLLRLDKAAKALAWYDKAVQAEPVSRSYSARARALYVLEHMDSFLLDVERALRLDSTNVEAHYQRALYAYRAQDYGRADLHCTRALDLGAYDPLRSRALLLRGESRTELGHQAEAIEDLRAGLASDPDNVEALEKLARCLNNIGKYSEALVIHERLCVLEPGEVAHWSNRGYTLAMLERHEEALIMYTQALKLDKDEPVALSNRAYSLMKMGRDDEAMKDLDKSLRAYPGNAFALRTRGIIRLRKGERDKACADLNMARMIGGVDGVDALLKEHCNNVPPPRR